MLSDEQRNWLAHRKITPVMPSPSGSFTAWYGDASCFCRKGYQLVIVTGKSVHPSRLGYYRVKWFSSDVEFDISEFELTYRGAVGVFLMHVFVAPVLHLKNWIGGMR